MNIRPLDFVKTPDGHIGIITEVHMLKINSAGDITPRVRIEFIGVKVEAASWWDQEDLCIIDNLADLLSRKLIHPAAENTFQPYHNPFIERNLTKPIKGRPRGIAYDRR